MSQTMNQGAQGVEQLLAPKFSDDTLSVIQQNAVTSISMLCTTFVGILQAFQNQANQKGDLQQQVQEMKYDLETAMGEMRKTTKSMQSTVDTVSANLKQQSEETDSKLQEMRGELNQSIAAANAQSTKTQHEIYQKMDVTEARMNSTVSDLGIITDRIESKLENMESEHENLKAEINEMASEVKENMATLQEGVSNRQQEIKDTLDNINNKFQSLRFEVDNLASTKADVTDLKWKVGKEEYSEYKLYIEVALTEIRAQSKENSDNFVEMETKTDTVIQELTQKLDTIQQQYEEEVHGIHETHRVDVDGMRKDIEGAQSAIDRLVEKKDFDDDDVVGMVHDLRENMQKLSDRIPRRPKKIPPGLSDDPSCTTLGGNCWSCGIPFRPKLKFSTKTKAGGGFNPSPPKFPKRGIDRCKSAAMTRTDDYITTLISNDEAMAREYGAMRVKEQKHKGKFKRSKSFCHSYRPTTAHL